ncbi:hypothetical protein GKZ68_12675 [Hymenobacter sp. BRD128]|uniref:hypothetical protein n=1 Tax=Hymenobacter sp. BRD128 TaxID=2675878 RepID=UPI001563A0DA|nr:hypothetical protein [Hymenobacter sp. BRD128]QKG57400.1 hypothetical protein GKZ68_12675 [Hymenobacter sp. BRD128]
MTHKEKWLLLAPGGLITIGAGACLISWAAARKENGAPPATWIAAGTAALAVFNAGVSIFGQSVVERVLHELREKPTGDTPGN